MEQDDDASGDVTGLSLAEAAERIAARDDRPDEATVRTVLAEVAIDRIVSEDMITELESDTSLAVSNAENRAEFAAMRVDEVEAAAADAPDLETIRARLEGFGARAESVETRARDLADRLHELIHRREYSDSVFEYVRDLRDLGQEADTLHGDAQQLASDADEFERWLDGHATRVAGLSADVNAISAAFDDLEAAADRLEAPAVIGADEPDPATQWFAVTQRQRVNELVLADARTELADVRTWADREGEDTAELDEIADRLDALESRRERLGERLEDLARPAWRDQYGDAVSAVETTLAEFEPPVDFGAVQAALDDHGSE
ncbi:halo transducer protein [Halorientalis pallida]|uniref:Halo transducer protein n=1 Tax=Halorientalis pallida TaxID=2479928 RepID=A0A498L0Q5_9EURY|nr:halo transducer protein [Halorientalis pallida]RXK51637.1 halo transducer protein [Halorientalis pallida]